MKKNINKYSEGFVANQAEKILTAGKDKAEAKKAIEKLTIARDKLKRNINKNN